MLLSTTLSLYSLLACELEPTACTEMGCSSTLQISLPEQAEGDYSLTLEIGDIRASCSLSLPLQEEPQCDDGDGLYLGSESDLILYLPMIEEADLPSEATLLLLDAEGETSFSGAASPEWGEPYYPNGEECDEVGCLSASLGF